MSINRRAYCDRKGCRADAPVARGIAALDHGWITKFTVDADDTEMHDLVPRHYCCYQHAIEAEACPELSRPYQRPHLKELTEAKDIKYMYDRHGSEIEDLTADIR